MVDDRHSETPASEALDSETPRLRSDPHQLLKKVEEVAAAIEEGGEETTVIHQVAEEIITRLRRDLGIYAGRLYERDGDTYVLRATFPEARPVRDGIRLPKSYQPMQLALMLGSVYMAADDPRLDRAVEDSLGVREFAAVEVGDGHYILGFSVSQDHDPKDVLFSLGVLRHSINQRIRRERLEDIFRQARSIQASILPKSPPVYGPFDIAARHEPLEIVGGDLHDFIPITDRILGVAIADASGHGLPAALQVRDVYTGLRMGLARDLKIVRTVERLNSIIHHSTVTSRFVSAFYGELEMNGTFIYVNAGHPAPFHLSAAGELRRLEEGGPVLGPLPHATYDRGFVHLEPGDLLVLFTDGITEAARDGVELDARDEFGTARVVEAVRSAKGGDAKTVVQAVFDAVDEWSGHSAPGDDRSLVVIRYPD